jgi:RNA-directed DNA polymerase
MSELEVPWFRVRRYLHFDRPLSLEGVKSIVESPQRVAAHGFYPFICYELQSEKIKKCKATGTLERKIKTRPIAYAAHLDSHIYSYYSHILSDAYENKLIALGIQECVLAFRSLGKSNIEFAKEAFDCVKSARSCVVIALDIKGFFDSLDHRILKSMWKLVLDSSQLPRDHYNVYKSVCRFGRVNRVDLYERFGISPHNPKFNRNRICRPEEFRARVSGAGLIQSNPFPGAGIPQGTPISAMLSNIYMLQFDVGMNEYAKSCSGRYMRYCDDILLILPQDKRDEALDIARLQISKLSLQVQDEKTEIRVFDEIRGKLRSAKPLQYLGFLFDGERTYLRSASLARYSERMGRGVALAKATRDKYNQKRIERGDSQRALYKKKIYKRYAYLGRRNFVSYGYRAARIFEGNAIRKQLRPLWGRLKRRLASE